MYYKLINNIQGLIINIIINKYISKLYSYKIFNIDDLRVNDNLQLCDMLDKISINDELSKYMKKNHCYTNFLIIDFIDIISINEDKRYY